MSDDFEIRVSRPLKDVLHELGNIETVPVALPDPEDPIIKGMSLNIPVDMLPALMEDQAIEQIELGQFVFTDHGMKRIREADCPEFEMSITVKKPLSW